MPNPQPLHSTQIVSSLLTEIISLQDSIATGLGIDWFEESNPQQNVQPELLVRQMLQRALHFLLAETDDQVAGNAKVKVHAEQLMQLVSSQIETSD